jgi:hypothetical protein
MAESLIVPVAEISIAMATGILAFFTYRLANETHKTTQEAKGGIFPTNRCSDMARSRKTF